MSAYLQTISEPIQLRLQALQNAVSNYFQSCLTDMREGYSEGYQAACQRCSGNSV